MMEAKVMRITVLRFEKVIFCFTMMTERMRLKTNWEDRRSAEVETGRYATPHEIRRLLNPNMIPTKIDKDNIFVLKSVKGFLLVKLRAQGRKIGMTRRGNPAH